MLKVLLAALADDSNVGHDFAKALRAVGVEAWSVCDHPHPFRYPSQSSNTRECAKELEEWTQTCDIVDFYNSVSIDLPSSLDDKVLVVQHGGGRYRNHPELMNYYWNQMVSATVARTGDLYGLGAAHETLVISPVDTDFLQPRKRSPREKVIVGHFPSIPFNKGTQEVCSIVQALANDPLYAGAFEFRTRQEPVRWLDQLDAIADCDVLIETLKPKLKGRTFGEPGVTSREAAALGCAVITNSHTTDLYEQEYGSGLPLLIANTPQKLKEHLTHVITTPHLRSLQHRTREWVVERHALAPTGTRLMEKVYLPAMQRGPFGTREYLGICTKQADQEFLEQGCIHQARALGHEMELVRRDPGNSQMICKKCGRVAGCAPLPPPGAECINGPAVDERCSQ